MSNAKPARETRASPRPSTFALSDELLGWIEQQAEDLGCDAATWLRMLAVSAKKEGYQLAPPSLSAYAATSSPAVARRDTQSPENSGDWHRPPGVSPAGLPAALDPEDAWRGPVDDDQPSAAVDAIVAAKVAHVVATGGIRPSAALVEVFGPQPHPSPPGGVIALVRPPPAYTAGAEAPHLRGRIYEAVMHRALPIPYLNYSGVDLLLLASRIALQACDRQRAAIVAGLPLLAHDILAAAARIWRLQPKASIEAIDLAGAERMAFGDLVDLHDRANRLANHLGAKADSLAAHAEAKRLAATSEIEVLRAEVRQMRAQVALGSMTTKKIPSVSWTVSDPPREIPAMTASRTSTGVAAGLWR